MSDLPVEGAGKLVFIEEEDSLVPIEETSHFFGSKFVKELTIKDFTPSGDLKDKKCSFVMFYAPWCGHCLRAAPEFSKFAETAAFIEAYAVNCEKNKDVVERLNSKSGDFVAGYPTLVIYKEGTAVETYEGDRTSAALLKEAMSACRG
jgi:thiol-disulfide isomerase/thioredoxin